MPSGGFHLSRARRRGDSLHDHDPFDGASNIRLTVYLPPVDARRCRRAPTLIEVLVQDNPFLGDDDAEEGSNGNGNGA